MVHPDPDLWNFQVIPAEAVEVAALIVHTFGGVKVPEARERALAILEAAAPHMLAEAYDDGFTACAHEHSVQDRDPAHPITRKNPHRTPDWIGVSQ